MKNALYRTKVSVTIPETRLSEVDRLVAEGHYPNRSAAFEDALKQLLRARMDARIEAEAAKLDRNAEIAEAEEGMDDFTDLVQE